MASAASACVPAFYRLVFLWLEPISILTGAIYAHCFPSIYLDLTHAASAPGTTIPVSTSIIMTQLANLYLGLAILEATVLRSTSDTKVWSTFIIGLLIADLGHLYSVRAVGGDIYWSWWRWNAIDWGNVPFVYFLAVTRICMLLGVGSHTHSARLKRS
ncbi:Nn.00g027310.m01.CDS01 [Neocucurbitaria sp. VM-36]